MIVCCDLTVDIDLAVDALGVELEGPWPCHVVVNRQTCTVR